MKSWYKKKKRKQFSHENLLNELRFKCKDDYGNSSALLYDVKSLNFLFLITLTLIKNIILNKIYIHTKYKYTYAIKKKLFAYPHAGVFITVILRQM